MLSSISMCCTSYEYFVRVSSCGHIEIIQIKGWKCNHLLAQNRIITRSKLSDTTKAAAGATAFVVYYAILSMISETPSMPPRLFSWMSWLRQSFRQKRIRCFSSGLKGSLVRLPGFNAFETSMSRRRIGSITSWASSEASLRYRYEPLMAALIS